MGGDGTKKGKSVKRELSGGGTIRPEIRTKTPGARHIVKPLGQTQKALRSDDRRKKKN